MSKNGRIADRVLGSLPIITAGCVLSFAAIAETPVEESLKQCGAIQDQAARLACYDEVASRKPEAEPPAPAVVETDAAAEQTSEETESVTDAAAEVAAAPTANDERLATLGDEQIGEQRKKSDMLEIQARVVSCKKDDFRRYFFYFENGQVWKQKSDRRLSYKECDFNITITKDFFGYKMLPEGETRRIRISRVK